MYPGNRLPVDRSTEFEAESLINRRELLQYGAALGLTGLAAGESLALPDAVSDIHVARFRFDVTPPKGHSLCGGWIKPVEAVDDTLEAIGYVLTGAGRPIVVCVVDWTGILNSAHVKWRSRLAEAAGTTADRVAVHCVHQHNAPFACLDAEKIVLDQGDLPHIVEEAFFNRCLDAGAQAVRDSLKTAVPVTHIGTGEAIVHQVASNRRIIDLNNRVVSQRGSSSRKPEHKALPEGLIDPYLKTIAFYNGEQKLVASHYYACHPMSYYGDGRVSSDFCGLARKECQKREPDCTHLYFNGCGGNIGAGKYNDGSQPMRAVLSERVLKGMLASQESLVRQPLESLSWSTVDLQPPLNPAFDESTLVKQISDSNQRVVSRNRPSYTVAFIRRVHDRIPITLSALHVNNATALHLPSESFIEYQLKAQAAAPNRFVACAAYGDGGPWYIPTAEAYPQGGYAVSVAWCSPDMDPMLRTGISQLLKKA